RSRRGSSSQRTRIERTTSGCASSSRASRTSLVIPSVARDLCGRRSNHEPRRPTRAPGPSLTLGMTGGAVMSNPETVADEMIAGVRARGDAYVAEQVERFDGVRVAPDEILIAPREVAIEPGLARALDIAIDRVRAFHLPQLPRSYQWEGVTHRVRPLRRVGVYVPGGRAVYVSTLIMCAVPARIAGVEEIVVATTPAAAARDELHYVCNRLGIRELYRSGGAAGIAALALGTESLPRVDKIVGPGNAYVTAAKARLVGQVGIDMTAGPTELVIIADDTANADFIQADLDAQQEHGPDSVVTCICIGTRIDVRATETFVVGTIDE